MTEEEKDVSGAIKRLRAQTKPRPAARFWVGYPYLVHGGIGLWGRPGLMPEDGEHYVDDFHRPMTRVEAEKAREALGSCAALYELVPVGVAAGATIANCTIEDVRAGVRVGEKANG